MKINQTHILPDFGKDYTTLTDIAANIQRPTASKCLRNGTQSSKIAPQCLVLVWRRLHTTVVIMWGGSMQGQRIYHHLYSQPRQAQHAEEWEGGWWQHIREIQHQAMLPALWLARAWQQRSAVGDKGPLTSLSYPQGLHCSWVASLSLIQQPFPLPVMNLTLNARQNWPFVHSVTTKLPFFMCVHVGSHTTEIWVNLKGNTCCDIKKTIMPLHLAGIPYTAPLFGNMKRSVWEPLWRTTSLNSKIGQLGGKTENRIRCVFDRITR